MAAKPKTPSASYQRNKILLLQARESQLQERLIHANRELEAALNRNVRAHETIRVLASLLTEADAQVATRRQLDDEIPF